MTDSGRSRMRCETLEAPIEWARASITTRLVRNLRNPQLRSDTSETVGPWKRASFAIPRCYLRTCGPCGPCGPKSPERGRGFPSQWPRAQRTDPRKGSIMSQLLSSCLECGAPCEGVRCPEHRIPASARPPRQRDDAYRTYSWHKLSTACTEAPTLL